MYLSRNASQQQIRLAERSRQNRQEIIKALSHGQVSRRELFKWGIFSVSGALAAKNGLNPFVGVAHAAIPTGVPASPKFGAADFSAPMPRCDLMERQDITSLSPTPQQLANVTKTKVVGPDGIAVDGPMEGRPPGALWAHQGWDKFAPRIAVEQWQRGARNCDDYRPGVDSFFNCGIDPKTSVKPCFHPKMAVQSEQSLWTFSGNAPPKLLLGRYGEPILFRHHNDLPPKVSSNSGFGRNTITTHEHNGHHGAENDGFAGAYFFPGQFYDYHWPIVHAGLKTINTTATDPRCGAPDGNGGITKLPGDWHETMSTHWFHDHMFSFTSQNVYKGIAAMFNLYSSLDRGNEAINDGVNLRLPSGTAKDWGNLEYDVNLMLNEKAFSADGQLAFDIFNFDGFLGDLMMVNLTYKPYFYVERRKYRFRILNASVSRFFKLALSNGAPMIQIGNDGNLLPRAVQLSELDEMGIAERYDIVIDFSDYSDGTKVHLVNLAEHQDGKLVAKNLALSEALSGKSADPCVGRFLEFRVRGTTRAVDKSRDFSQPGGMVLIPNPDLSKIPIARERTFEFNRGAKQTTRDPISSALGPWGVKLDGGDTLAADFGRVSAAPKAGTREVWTLVNGGGGWDHPIHIHFEEGQVLARDGMASNVPLWERGRKDVYRLRPGGSITITLQFRDWGGMFMEHCHNTVHEDNAMLLRWDVNASGTSVLTPLPTPIPKPTGVEFLAPTETLRNA
ncbi:multicopper oxidase family protein [Variovorax sp. RHLX14]|uniref:multicopper oxidase family protein n=1 Tax=Variovorax sp. RHLX14 TaxID=1259731 RepID=UPI003F47E2BE